MGRMLKYDSTSRLSKLKKSISSPEGSSRLSIRDWRRNKSNNSVEMELLTELPVPTVPPYPIEYFEESDNGLSHINMAFKFSEESLPPAVTYESTNNFLPSRNDENGDNDSKGSAEDSPESVGGSTVDSGVVMHSSEHSRTSGSSNDFRTSPDGRAEKDINAERMGKVELKNGSTNNAYDHYSRAQAIGYPTYPLRPGQSHSRGGSGSSQPISNGTLKHSTEQMTRIRTRPVTHCDSNSENYQDLRGRIPVPNNRPTARVSSVPPNIKEHIYVNRPLAPAPLMDSTGPPPYPGTSRQHFNFDSYRPTPQTKVEPPQPLPHLGSQIRSQLWQTSATPKPCGRSKSVHDEYRRTDTNRSRLGSINTLGIPYQTTLPARLPKKQVLSLAPRSINNVPRAVRSNGSKKPDLILTVPINKVKLTSQANSPFKKSTTPVYSKVCKQRKSKKIGNFGSDNMNTKLLSNSKSTLQSYSTITPKLKPESTCQGGNTIATVFSGTVNKIQHAPLTIRCKSEEGTTSADGVTSPLYEELLHLHEDDEDEEENGQYSIEVRIDYSKGTKYKVEKRRRQTELEKSDNNNNTNEDQIDGKIATLKKSNDNKMNTSINSEKMKQFRQEKKNTLCAKFKNKSEVNTLTNGISGKLRMFTFCCCW